MAGNTVRELSDSFFEMLFSYLLFGVGMAVGAGISGIIAGVTGLAWDHPLVTVIEGESVGLQLGRGPGGSCMAAFTL